MSDDLMQKFSGLVDMAEGGLQSKVHEQALRIQAQAKELCPVRRYGSGGGSLRQSIHVSTERQEDLIHPLSPCDLKQSQQDHEQAFQEIGRAHV